MKGTHPPYRYDNDPSHCLKDAIITQTEYIIGDSIDYITLTCMDIDMWNLLFVMAYV